MQRANDDFLAGLVADAKRTVREGYYDVERLEGIRRRSLVRSVTNSRRTPIIAEVKFRSPAEGKLGEGDPIKIAKQYEEGGAAAISVLAEPKHFDGGLDYVGGVKRSVRIPVLMKDIVVDRVQIDAAELVGADSVLLMANIFFRRLAEGTLEGMIAYAHERHLETLVEAHTDSEYSAAMNSEADLVGINNRNLETLDVSLGVSKRLLVQYERPKPVVCESGISTRSQIASLKALGASAFLVGSALMKSRDPTAKLRELVGA